MSTPAPFLIRVAPGSQVMGPGHEQLGADAPETVNGMFGCVSVTGSDTDGSAGDR